MTCCVAALCAEKSAIVLVADRLIGFSMITTEPKTSKIIDIGKGWWLMYAADDIASLFPIADSIKAKLQALPDKPTVADVENELTAIVQKRRLEEAEAYVLTPRGLTLQSLPAISSSLPTMTEEIYRELAAYRLPMPRCESASPQLRTRSR